MEPKAVINTNSQIGQGCIRLVTGVEALPARVHI